MMDPALNACPSFNCPHDWTKCEICCNRHGIDLRGINIMWDSFDTLQVSIHFRTLVIHDLESDNHIANCGRWKKILKSDFVLKDHPIARRQLEAFGVLDKLVDKYEPCFKSNLLEFWQEDIENYYALQNFDDYVLAMADKFATPGFDVALAIRKILRFVRRMKIFRKKEHDRFFESFVRCLVAEMFEHCREDSELVIDFIETSCVHQHFKDKFFLHIKDFEELKFIMHHANVRDFDFWGLYNNKGRTTINPIEYFIEDERIHMVWVMLNYGYQYGHRKHDAKGFIKRMKRSETLRSSFYPLYHRLRSKELFMMILLLETFSYSQRTEADVQLIQLLFSDSSLPYVTPEHLSAFSRLIINPECKDKYIRACTEYASAEIFDETHDVFRPRKLVHLSRTVIRQLLRQNRQLPYGIEKLGLPDLMKSYLNLDMELVRNVNSDTGSDTSWVIGSDIGSYMDSDTSSNNDLDMDLDTDDE